MGVCVQSYSKALSAVYIYSIILCFLDCHDSTCAFLTDCHDSTCAFLIVMLILLYALFYSTCVYLSECVCNAVIPMYAFTVFVLLLLLLFVVVCGCYCLFHLGFLSC